MVVLSLKLVLVAEGLCYLWCYYLEVLSKTLNLLKHVFENYKTLLSRTRIVCAVTEISNYSITLFVPQY